MSNVGDTLDPRRFALYNGGVEKGAIESDGLLSPRSKARSGSTVFFKQEHEYRSKEGGSEGVLVEGDEEDEESALFMKAFRENLERGERIAVESAAEEEKDRERNRRR